MSVTIQHKSLISVVMPIYNTEAYVGAAIGSLLAQTYSNLEILLVDDGSTDCSPAIIAEYARRDSRIRPIFTPHHNGPSALNAGISAATGEYIALLDSDDLALPERLAVQLEWMRRMNVGLCGSCAKRFGGDQSVMWFPEGHAAIRVELLFRCALLPSTVLARASVLKENLHAEEMSDSGADYELWTRLAPRYRLGNMPRILVQYRTHAKQISVVKAEQWRGALHRHQHRYFFTLFPEAGAEDYAAIVSIAEAIPSRTLAELERAGAWLVRLTDSVSDNFLHTQMTWRWMKLCRKSARLGLDCFALQEEIAAQISASTKVVNSMSGVV